MAEQALEKAVAKTPEVIRTPEEYRGTLLRWKEQRYNILTPFVNFSGIADGYGLQSALVDIVPDKAAGDVYDSLPFLKKDEFALAKTGLFKLAEALGVSFRTVRTDPRTIPLYWEFKAICSYRGIDGSIITREATKEWDLRDGAPQMKGWTANQIDEGRKHGLRNCEARAINAAIRSCGCGIKQKYTKAELQRAFATVRVAFQADMKDPAIKAMVTAQALAGTSALYPPVSAAAPIPEPPEEDDTPREPRSVGRGSTTPAPNPEPVPAAAEEPPTKDAVRLVAITSTSGTNDNGRKWQKWAIVDSTGAEHATFSRSIKDAAEKFITDKTWVEIDEEESEDGRFTNVVQIQPAAQPTLPLPDATTL